MSLSFHSTKLYAIQIIHLYYMHYIKLFTSVLGYLIYRPAIRAAVGSKFLFPFPLHDQTCESVITAFKQGWIYRGHGVPQMIPTEHGSKLDGAEFRTFVRFWMSLRSKPHLITRSETAWPNVIRFRQASYTLPAFR